MRKITKKTAVIVAGSALLVDPPRVHHRNACEVGKERFR